MVIELTHNGCCTANSKKLSTTVKCKIPSSVLYGITLLPQERLSFFLYFTSNPSSLRQALWASISLMQSGCSSPLKTTHSSRGFFVSGQQQQIGFPVLMPTFFFGWDDERYVNDDDRLLIFLIIAFFTIQFQENEREWRCERKNKTKKARPNSTRGSRCDTRRANKKWRLYSLTGSVGGACGVEDAFPMVKMYSKGKIRVKLWSSSWCSRCGLSYFDCYGRG